MPSNSACRTPSSSGPDTATGSLNLRGSALREIMEYGIEGCLRHIVPASYTNIAILNAGNLIALGEMLERPDAAEEGYRRLEALCLWTWCFGTSEYNSPTYTAVDIDGLDFIFRFAARQEGRSQAEALLRLFWTDVAANWFPASGRLAGSQSRSYDYLSGAGTLNHLLRYQGWIEETAVHRVTDLQRPALCQWQPPADLTAIRDGFPRTVRQSWGPQLVQSRTHAVYADVSLSTSGAAYGTTDMPLTVDLPGQSSAPRCYFIADGREDPYGRQKYETSSARHLKALHLQPFWAAAQRSGDAVSVAVYRPQDLAADEVTNCQSHFVIHRGYSSLHVAGRRMGTVETAAIAIGEPIVLRYGTAALGIRVLWTRSQDGTPGEVRLIDDRRHSVMRLTMEHRREQTSAMPGAALWVRVGTSLNNESMFTQWRNEFESLEPVTIQTTDERIRIEVPGVDGLVSVAAAAPFGQGDVTLTPEPSTGVLEIDGQERGRPLLEHLECIQRHEERIRSAGLIDVPASAGVYWEAESGLVFPGMSIGRDQQASRGQFIWHPPENTWGRAASTVIGQKRVGCLCLVKGLSRHPSWAAPTKKRPPTLFLPFVPRFSTWPCAACVPSTRRRGRGFRIDSRYRSELFSAAAPAAGRNRSATRQRNPGTTSSPSSSSFSRSTVTVPSSRWTRTAFVSGFTIQTSFTPAASYSSTFSSIS